MRIRRLIDEDFVNYKHPSMFICTVYCTGKCFKELGLDNTICFNFNIKSCNILDIDDDVIIRRYLNNSLTSSIVFGGLEPFDQYPELYCFIDKLRNEYNCYDTIVIYTGYKKEEVLSEVLDLITFDNIIIKYGRYVPNSHKVYDDVLGVELSSDNQYAEKYIM